MTPLHSLTPEDLRTTPVWRYVGVSDEDAVVEPTGLRALSEEGSEVYIAVTEFVLRNGQRHIGFCSPADDSGLDYLQPVIVTSRGHVALWLGHAVKQEVRVLQWASIGVSEAEALPITYECPIPVDGRRVTGTIEV